MHLKSLTVRNFRALQDISIEFDSLVSVIVGPNAIGKTTILEAIRFAKGLLAPRTASEANQIMFSLGIASPHMPQMLSFAAIARDATRPVEVSCRYSLSPDQKAQVSGMMSQLAASLVQTRLGQAFGNPVSVIQFMSSPQGQAALQAAEKELGEFIGQLESNPYCVLDLTIDPQGNARGANQFAQIIASALDSVQPPSQTVFSYFPADRSLPTGEPGVQIGAIDAAQQLESHNSQPQLKYARLKNTIFSLIAHDAGGRERLQHEFQRIFESVLKGRRLDSVGINDRGTLSIKVVDSTTGRGFDIDSMSSGEKGLILTFLLMSQSMSSDGLLLLDEPELHLNPAVCKDVLGFLIDTYALPKNVQAIICTHSPEILAGALDRDDCSLYHLRSESAITKVRIRDEAEVASSLQRLGSSQSESLLYRGTVFAEGTDDVALLDVGFENRLNRYKIKDLGGRKEVEKEIIRLQEGEAAGEEFPLTLFIFDLDRAPSSLKSSTRVKIIQWRRRTIENYLLGVDVLTDLLTDSDVAKAPLQNMGQVSDMLRRLADDQLTDTAARDVYESRAYTSPGLRKMEIQGKSVAEAAQLLFTRLEQIKNESNSIDDRWQEQFVADVEQKRIALKAAWDADWVSLCDGKRLFKDLQQEVPLKMSLQKFKRQVMVRMRLQQSDAWLSMDGLIGNALE